MLSHSPGNLIFAGVISQILLLTLAGEFLNLLLLLTGASSNRMSHNFVQKDVNLTFSSEKLNYVTFSYLKVTLSSKVK